MRNCLMVSANKHYNSVGIVMYFLPFRVIWQELKERLFVPHQVYIIFCLCLLCIHPTFCSIYIAAKCTQCSLSDVGTVNLAIQKTRIMLMQAAYSAIRNECTVTKQKLTKFHCELAYKQKQTINQYTAQKLIDYFGFLLIHRFFGFFDESSL